VNVAEKTNQLSGPEQFVADATVSGLASVIAQIRDAAGQALADTGAALFALLGNSKVNLAPIQTTGQVPTTQTNGTVSDSINKAPDSAPSSGGPVSQSVTVNNPSGSTVAVKETYSSTDGTFASASDNCTNGTITVPLSVPASAAGVVGTWTTSVTGLPDQTITTTWT
jgi:hypothetical protein